MSKAESISAADVGSAAAWRRVEAALAGVGDRINPILVKETRQALKSRQFTVTFVLLLLAGWIWSIFGVAWVGPRIYYSFEGPLMFYGYFLILAFPLAVVVPFSAYRSLATEREDNTYELLSISTLKPRQIVSGKLGSAVIQMLVYFSAIAPCLAFTYLLRGIDIVTVGVMLYYAFFGSLGLSMIGLFVATLRGSKYMQVIFSVALVAGLFLAFWATVEGAPEVMREIGSAVDHWEFWVGNAVLLNAYALYFALVFLATAAQLTFVSENRSTALRVVMLAMHVCFSGWMAWIWLVEGGDEDALAIYAMFTGIHWYFFGALMTGEWPHLSDRVKRRLPQSLLGRAVLTWFNPGPGTGYVFAIGNLAGAAVLIVIAAATAQSLGMSRAGRVPGLIAFVVLGTSYIALYLGLGKLVVDAGRKVFHVTLSGAVGIQLMLLALGMGIPVAIHLSSPSLRNLDYTLLQISNPLWTLAYVVDGRGWPPETPALLGIVSALAGLIFALNLPALVREIAQVRVSKPQRILEEEAELAPKEAPAPESPWG